MANQFDNVIDTTIAQDVQFKKYTTGGDQSRWADILTKFFESAGIESRRNAKTASNIDAVENLTKNPVSFLQLLQRIVPGAFTFGEQVATENDNNFTAMIQEMLPISDEDRADLKRMLGRNIPEHEIEAVITNGGVLVQMIQQGFPEFGIQVESALSRGIDMIANNKLTKKLGGTKLGRGLRSVKDVASGAVKTMPFSHKLTGSQTQRRINSGVARGKEQFKKGVQGIKQDWKDSDLKKIGRGMGSVGGKFGSAIDSVGGKFGSAISKAGSFIPSMLQKSDLTDTGGGDVLASAANKIFKHSPASRTNPIGGAMINRSDTARLDSSNEVDDATVSRVKTYGDLMMLLTRLGLQQDTRYINLMSNKSDKDRIDSSEIDKLKQLLKHDKLYENLHMKKTFNNIIQHAGKQLLEAPEDEMDIDSATDTATTPPAAPPAPEPATDLAPDDMDKLQADMLELVRRALIINPKDIDQESYMQLTTRVSFDNMQQVKPLLLKLVQNHYPDLDMGDVPKGPGT